jgi:hypothetical protein
MMKIMIISAMFTGICVAGERHNNVKVSPGMLVALSQMALNAALGNVPATATDKKPRYPENPRYNPNATIPKHQTRQKGSFKGKNKLPR